MSLKQGEWEGQLRPSRLAKLAKERPKRALSMAPRNVGDRAHRERVKAERGPWTFKSF
jgi:hypothetical protein